MACVATHDQAAALNERVLIELQRVRRAHHVVSVFELPCTTPWPFASARTSTWA